MEAMRSQVDSRIIATRVTAMAALVKLPLNKYGKDIATQLISLKTALKSLFTIYKIERNKNF